MAVTNNIDDIYALTPSMLVNGSRLDAIPQPRLQKADEFPVKRFRALQQLLSQFWKRWSSEYVASLQPRGKWRHECANLAVDNVVLVTDDGIPPLQWSLGRVIQVKLGHDGLARVALVKHLVVNSRGQLANCDLYQLKTMTSRQPKQTRLQLIVNKTKAAELVCGGSVVNGTASNPPRGGSNPARTNIS